MTGLMQLLNTAVSNMQSDTKTGIWELYYNLFFVKSVLFVPRMKWFSCDLSDYTIKWNYCAKFSTVLLLSRKVILLYVSQGNLEENLSNAEQPSNKIEKLHRNIPTFLIELSAHVESRVWNVQNKMKWSNWKPFSNHPCV